MSTNLHSDVETRLGQNMPEVEVLLVELSSGALRITIDHPEGVTLGLCEQVTHTLSELREQYALEVSSPGRERPLTKPDHFRRYLGRRARVRTRVSRDGHKSFTGELVGASDAEVTIAVPEGMVSIPYADIHRSNLVEE